MIYSMTAFAENEISAPFGSLRIELKSVNHRYLEISFKLPDWARDLEVQLRSIARQTLIRGKVDCNLQSIFTTEMGTTLEIDDSLVKQVLTAAQKIQTLATQNLAIAPLSALDILRWPNVVKSTSFSYDALREAIPKAFEHTLHLLMENRSKEGEFLKVGMLDRIERMASIVEIIKDRAPEEIKLYREKILSKLEEWSIDPDPNRLAQEIVFAAQRMDIEEEIDRFNAHLYSAKQILQSGGTVGRQLDFLMQELNREANTMASKSNDLEITHKANELKILIEQIREQVQNLV